MSSKSKLRKILRNLLFHDIIISWMSYLNLSLLYKYVDVLKKKIFAYKATKIEDPSVPHV